MTLKILSVTILVHKRINKKSCRSKEFIPMWTNEIFVGVYIKQIYFNEDM